MTNNEFVQSNECEPVGLGADVQAGDAMTCDHVDCEAEAEWSLEVCPMPNDGASVVYACTQHVGDLSDGVTEARGLGKAEQ